MNIVILAGGAGTRLWPMSSKEKPKQFQKLVSSKTMLQETVARVLFVGIENITICTNKEYESLVREQIPELPETNLILEPTVQDTGPSIGLAAALIAQKNPDAIMSVVYADHLVQDEKEFREKLEAAAALAEKEDTLNIMEVKAKYPNTNLGYVRIGRMLKEENGVEVYEFKAFKEKPDYETAKRFLSSYSYLWNTGYYVWRVSTILKEFEKHLPQTYEQLVRIQNGTPIEEAYPLCDKISIDYGVMEKVDPHRVRIIPADLGWSDIGTFASLHDELAQEPGANLTKGKVLAVDSEGCLLYNEGTDLMAAFGLKDMVVVNADGHTLICPKNRSADLKILLKKLHESADRNQGNS
jgi:mannose-1-phosphate guanylyltransferase